MSNLTIADEARLNNAKDSSSAVNILDDVRVKDRLEKKAFDALERRMEPQKKICKPCKGEGSRSNGDECGLCEGFGYVIEDVDMRAIELVLSPKFPKTQVNLNADLDGMGTSELLRMIEGM